MMTSDPQVVKAERHEEIGNVIQRDSKQIILRWSRRAIEEQPQATRDHHETLLDHLPHFLEALGHSLAESERSQTDRHRDPATKHGAQRWQNGWSLVEVVRDYQILRLVILAHLNEVLERPLRPGEAQAIGLALDEAISDSVNCYVAHQQQAERLRTENLRREEEARHLTRLEELKEIDRRKDDFLALLGHELRNPLAPVRNALQVLHLRGEEVATRSWVSDLLERQVNQMTRLVDDLLDISRIGRGKVPLQHGPVDLAELVRTTVEDRRGIVQAAGLDLQLQLPGESVWVEGDATRLAQVVQNLLTNAGKFTRSGGRVTVCLSLQREGGTAGAVLTVKDTGIGVAPELLPHLFKPFLQAEQGTDRSRGGLGLGLALVKGLIELHGGRVIAVSAGPGQGSEFGFWLPVRTPATPPTAAGSSSPPQQGLAILIIEDHADAGESLRMLLELHGHRVALAQSGPAGLALAQQFRPDVILCDLGLPGMDGFAVAEALRQEAATAQVPVIALSGYASPTDQHRCAEAGFRCHLTKPVELEELHRVLADLKGAASHNPAG